MLIFYLLDVIRQIYPNIFICFIIYPQLDIIISNSAKLSFCSTSAIQVRNCVTIGFITNRTLIFIPVETITMHVFLPSLYPLPIQPSIAVHGEVEHLVCCLDLFRSQLHLLQSKSECVFDALIGNWGVGGKRCLHFSLIEQFEAVLVEVWIL